MPLFLTKPGVALPVDGAMTEALTVGPVLSTVTLKPAMALLVALSVALTVYAFAPAARAASAVWRALR